MDEFLTKSESNANSGGCRRNSDAHHQRFGDAVSNDWKRVPRSPVRELKFTASQAFLNGGNDEIIGLTPATDTGKTPATDTEST